MNRNQQCDLLGVIYKLIIFARHCVIMDDINMNTLKNNGISNEYLHLIQFEGFSLQTPKA